ncbi:MAG: SAM-dependent methyltransferase, partial [Acidobacteriaceae bacterium]
MADLQTNTPAAQDAESPAAIISRRAADRLRAGHPWVYASDVEEMIPSAIAPGALVQVADARGMLLGTALYSSSSQIALRLLTQGTFGSREEFLVLLGDRLRRAIQTRLDWLRESDGTNACRLI